MADKKLKDFPIDAFFSQVKLYIRDKYKLIGDDNHDSLRCEFAQKYLMDKYMFRRYNKMRQKEIDTLIIPNNIKTYFEAVIFDKPHTEIDKKRYFFSFSDTGINFFMPIFKNIKLSDVWTKLNKKSKDKTLEFIVDLIKLPWSLSSIYAKANSGKYQSALRYHAAIETFLKETYIEEDDGWTSDMPFTYSDCRKEMRNIHEYPIPDNRISGNFHRDIIELLEGYYERLENLLPILKEQEPPQRPEEKLILQRTNSKTTPEIFWARYMADAFRKSFGSPHSAEIAEFINVMYDTNYTYYDINNLVRQNM